MEGFNFSLGLAINSYIEGCAWYDKVVCDGEVVQVLVEPVALHEVLNVCYFRTFTSGGSPPGAQRTR